MIKIYIDEQNTREKQRIRVMDGNLAIAAFYADNISDANRIKNFSQKLIDYATKDNPMLAIKLQEDKNLVSVDENNLQHIRSRGGSLNDSKELLTTKDLYVN